MVDLTKFNPERFFHMFRPSVHHQGYLQTRRQEIENDVRKIGADSYDILLPETRNLHQVLHPNEEIEGIVYGRYKTDNEKLIGRGALVATPNRIILIDKKPLFFKFDEIEYKVVSAVSYSWIAITGTVSLHTRMGNIELRTFNKRCARHFVKMVEQHLFTSENK